jgi:hypothetical protein
VDVLIVICYYFAIIEKFGVLQKSNKLFKKPRDENPLLKEAGP